MAKNYQSEITQFLKKYKDEHAGTEQRQREGRARLWDRNLDFDMLENFRSARVPQRAYVYQTDD